MKTNQQHIENCPTFGTMIPVPGFSGYAVDAFNRVVSYRSKEGALVSVWKGTSGSGQRIDCVTLYDDTGKRRCRSLRKLLVDLFGKEEYEHRETTKKERYAAMMIEKEQHRKQLEEKRRLDEIEAQEIVNQIHAEAEARDREEMRRREEKQREIDANFHIGLRRYEEKEILGELF